MNSHIAQQLIETLRSFSKEAEEVIRNIERYDYGEESAKWHEEYNPTVIEAEHPTLHNLDERLTKHIMAIPYRNDNLPKERLLSHKNISDFVNYLQTAEDPLLAAKVKSIQIEPIKAAAEAFKSLNLLKEHRRFNNIYEFAYGIRRWHNASMHNPGTPVTIKLDLNYDEVSPVELQADEGYKIFHDLFRPSCNYTTAQKRALYNSLKELYATSAPKEADKTVMAVILLFRKPRTIYKQPFEKYGITECKKKAMAAFGRDITCIRSYSGNSLDSSPKLAQKYVKTAESIIAKALEYTR